MSKLGIDYYEVRERAATKDNLYSFLDDETKAKVALKDVKISLLKEHIEKAKSK